ncbi:uncharacterized protein B0P05DRAFT_561788 [Gilbertella persicaria]|nr:uncharacterized protein B0P05DRAFT_561788 [Gilbertella persicaria]KAI8053149.1 hypothetical protein B0P05DRAFT_561788 [Gilbertella persicaria]
MDAELTQKRKTSVTFDLPAEQQGDEETAQELLSPCATSPTIDIHAQIVPDTMLVALFDRASEMKELIHYNKTFFLALKSHLGTKWPRFENTLYCERQKMPDYEWMKRISKALQAVPSLLEKFKELVGYLGEEEEEEEAADTASDYFFSHVPISRIRRMPQRLSKESYPQFFINCQESLGDDYQAFYDLLFTSPDQLEDHAWEQQMHERLKSRKNILEQLQEIVAYEIEEEE